MLYRPYSEQIDRGLEAYEKRGIKAFGCVCDVTEESAVNASIKFHKFFKYSYSLTPPNGRPGPRSSKGPQPSAPPPP